MQCLMGPGSPTLPGIGFPSVRCPVTPRSARKGLHTPVIFVTGQPGDELEIKGLELGAVDFIRKPIKKDVLLLRVRKALRAN